jgi:hypothetical protein
MSDKGLAPGEFIGQDGRTYRWEKERGYLGVLRYLDETKSWIAVRGPHLEDIADSNAALTALAWEPKWVEFLNGHYRVTPDGERVEHRPPSGNFAPMEGDYTERIASAAYRAGLAQGRKEAGELVAAMSSSEWARCEQEKVDHQRDAEKGSVERRMVAAEKRVAELEAAIGKQCRECDCSWEWTCPASCPLYPYREAKP